MWKRKQIPIQAIQSVKICKQYFQKACKDLGGLEEGEGRGGRRCSKEEINTAVEQQISQKKNQ